ncbi:hypothetical protein AA313_de0202424 [Arthrobotrys entomopaga]|nr:hypothetical protein AA313_de0202424 [Arthrobotrys entomopaga]
MVTDKEKKKSGGLGCVYLEVPTEPTQDTGNASTSTQPQKHHMRLRSAGAATYDPDDDKNKGVNANELTRRLDAMKRPKDEDDEDWIMVDSPPRLITMKPRTPSIKKRRRNVEPPSETLMIPASSQDLRESTILPPRAHRPRRPCGCPVEVIGCGHPGSLGINPRMPPGLDARHEALQKNLKRLEELSNDFEEDLNSKRKR